MDEIAVDANAKLRVKWRALLLGRHISVNTDADARGVRSETCWLQHVTSFNLKLHYSDTSQ